MLAFTEATDTPNIHVFDNAAFSDDEEEEKEEMATVNVSWSSPRPSFFDSMESDSGKENRSPDAFSSVAYSWRPQKPLKPLNPQSGTTVEKPLNLILKNGVSFAAKNTSESDRISAGIEDIENEIRRLTGKLAELRFQQAAAAEAEEQAQGKQHAECEKNKGEKEKKREVEVMVGDSCNLQNAACVRQPVRRGRIVAAKFMTGVASLHKKMVEVQEPPTRFLQDRRKSCFTRLPIEEKKEMRKGSRSLSLSPRKPAPRIFKISGFPTVGAKVPVRKADVTTLAKPKALFPDNVAGSGRRDYSGKVPDQPIASLQSRRKSCYYKLPKESVEKAKGPRSSSLSPKKPRPSVSKTPGFLTVGSKQPVKRDGLTNLTQPKTLFPDNVAGIGRRDYSGKVPDQPITSLQIRRKSCYYKLPKEGVEKAKGPRSTSLSPKKPRPSISKTPGFLTVGSKKPVKRDGVINLTQPKTLFQGEEAGGGRKPVAGNMKSSRVVGSRYVKTSTVSKKGVAACGSQTNLKVTGKQASRKEVAKKTGGEAKRPPAKEVLDADNGTVDNGEPVTPQKPEQESPAPRRRMWMQESPVTAMANLLPKIRTIRTTPESPRDSGCVKRAIDRIGMLSYFQEDELVSRRSLDPLSFEEE